MSMKRKIEESLRRTAQRLPQPDLEEMMNAPTERMEQHDYITKQEAQKKRPMTRRLVAAGVCACLAVAAALGIFTRYGEVGAVVDMDVNPGFEITVTNSERVKEIRPVDEDAERVLDARSYSGWKLEDAVEDLVEEIIDRGYLENGAILLSVNSGDTAIREKVYSYVREVCSRTRPDTGIYWQDLETDEALEERARMLGISPGKLQIIDQIIAQEPAFSEAKLADMSVAELIGLAEKYGISIDGMDKQSESAQAVVQSAAPTQVQSAAPTQVQSAAPTVQASEQTAPPEPAETQAAEPTKKAEKPQKTKAPKRDDDDERDDNDDDDDDDDNDDDDNDDDDDDDD